ncbi:unnamed protein product [Cylicocyclus nassatus]|uniref:Uncharacterized protein n=1 Tax=Cylicocyclus nassatus TaxID=53992 RepID=A0AA36MCM1_CYLNA|nr:unnamed protein product [Cylicocyclus nassatus]
MSDLMEFETSYLATQDRLEIRIAVLKLVLGPANVYAFRWKRLRVRTVPLIVYEGVFLASKLGDASATGLPVLDNATLKLFHDNGIHGEVVGFAAKEERECGIVLLDYSSYTDGRMFDGVLEPFEKSLNISLTPIEEMRMKVYTVMKEDAKKLHLREMEAEFKKYRAVTPHYSTGQLEFFPGSRRVIEVKICYPVTMEESIGNMSMDLTIALPSNRLPIGPTQHDQGTGFGQGTDVTGLKRLEVDWEPGKKEEVWVGSYPYPKVRASYHKTAYGGQFFVLDKKSKKWIDYYLKLRDFVIRMNHLEGMMEPTSPFFLQYKGSTVERYNVSHIMKQFLRDSGYKGLNVSCNATRHAIATGQYEDFYRKKCEQLGIADEDMTQLASHSKRIQLARYQDAYMTSCAYGYVKVRQVAQRQEAENQDAVQRVRDMFKLANLESRRRTAVPDVVADMLELEDFDDDVSSLSSDSEEDHPTNVLEEQPGPSSRTDPTRQRVTDKRIYNVTYTLFT